MKIIHIMSERATRMPLVSVALASVLIQVAGPGRANDPCTQDQSTLNWTCSGDQSDGISDGKFGLPTDFLTSLFVEGLTSFPSSNPSGAVMDISNYYGLYHYSQPDADPAVTTIDVQSNWAGVDAYVANYNGIYVGGSSPDETKTGTANLTQLTLDHIGNVVVSGTSSVIDPDTGSADPLSGIYVESIGGTGKNGENSGDSGHPGANLVTNFDVAIGGGSTVINDATGYSGGSASCAGKQTVTGAGIYVCGSGGKGGKGDAAGSGVGGTGPASMNFNSTGAETISVNTAEEYVPGILIAGYGGDGSRGGDGNTVDKGHEGSDGGDANVTNADGSVTPWQIGHDDTAAWNVTTKGAYSDAISIIGAGGNAGRGGNNSDGKGGGTGGIGGTGADIDAWTGDFADLTTYSQSADSVNLLIVSQGGAGGNGGEADFAKGGAGNTGGDSGAIILGGGSFRIGATGVGSQSHGVYVHSKAGAGGDGGEGKDDGTGGDGGAGGDAGDVSVTGSFNVTTSGGQSHGVAVYSTGGAGGDAGKGGDDSGGGSGNAGDLTLVIHDTVTTNAADSYGVTAQSIGGHAGDSGGCTGTFVCFGAKGASAGDGGQISLTNNATITTNGDGSEALVATSHGGGGGSGGSDFGSFFGSGGGGGGGGDGGAVTVNNAGGLTTAGADATAISAMSVGGSGGRGGITAALATLGMGSGGKAGGGGNVMVTNSGSIITGDPSTSTPAASGDPTCGVAQDGTGQCSEGIFATSIGGSGGKAGTTVGMFSIGSAGGKGGDAGEVVVTNSGSIETHLNKSEAIFAHSTGGGGGKGSATISGAVDSASIAIGGTGGDGGTGAGVIVINEGADLTTHGSDSAAISAKSHGGGGGSGGFSVAVSASAGSYGSGSFAVGGAGGSGGDAEAVCVGNVQSDCTASIESIGPAGASGTITTFGDNSAGIDAQSTGGGGGSGGFAISVQEGASYFGGAFAVGGSGGDGGNGEKVTVVNDMEIQTTGDDSYGIVARSHGGGGGHGGFSIAGTILLGGPESYAIAVGVGGAGGNAADVEESPQVSNSGDITTSGSQAHGIFAHAVGGGGGHGGMAIAGDIVAAPQDDGEDGAGISHAHGGGGGNGGAVLGEVKVTNDGTLLITGGGSQGILAQSVGGGGGSGGLSFSANTSIGVGSTLQIAKSHGGTGGTGGDANAVTVANSGDITTGVQDSQGQPEDSPGQCDAHAIFAQSVGGGGGNGGFSGTLNYTNGTDDTSVQYGVSVGGTGGGSGVGQAVTVTSNSGATLKTTSDQSFGIFAQSVGGGGGNGGGAYAGSVVSGSENGTTNIQATNSVGGNAKSGSIGGVVIINSGSTITTAGDYAHGILAQSVGGGGGTAGSAQSYVKNHNCQDSEGNSEDCDGSDGNVSFQHTVGGSVESGSESTDSDGGKVTINSTGSISTTGGDATAIYAQSIGGGGGDGGNATTKHNTGNSAFGYGTVVIGVGGTGGAGGDGETVTVTQTGGTLQTTGPQSPGIYAQSIGAGGGKGGVGSTGKSGTITVGGDGAGAGDGGDVWIYNSADITTGTSPGTSDDTTTVPDASYGIFAQSIGGGGGSGGNACSSTKCGGSVNFGVDLSGGSGSGGNGGTVTVAKVEGQVDYNLTTYGDGSMGIVAQSVGGGGGVSGNAGFSAGTAIQSLWGSNGGNGVGGEVDVSYAGTLKTSGDGATGIFAQSAGGKGTLTGSQGEVYVAVDGTIEVGGADASAILAQSVMLDSNGNAIGAGSSTVNVNADAWVTGGTGGDVQSGAGVEIRDGVNNIINNQGFIGSAGPNSIVYTGSGTCTLNDTKGSQSCQTTVNNTGMIEGNIVFNGPGSGRGKVDNSGKIIGAFVDDFAEDNSVFPAASPTASPATQVINRQDGEIVTSGTSTFDQITNYGRIEVEGDGGPATFTHAGESMVHTGSGSVILNLWDSAAGGPYNDRLASTGIVSFDFGSSLFLETVDGFRPGKGFMFDLMLAEDLRFGTETDADFDLFDYVSAPFLNRNDWALSLINGYGSFENVGLMAGLASPELLRLTRVAPIPLPGSLFLYGSALLFAAAARRQRRQTREC